MKKLSGEFEYDRFIVPYRVYGEHDKVIVCISGAKQTMSAWYSFVKFFSGSHRIILFDMPGQGRSQILSGSAGVSLAEQVDILYYLLAHLELQDTSQRFLVGGSWGSIVAAAYEDKYPGFFHKLILGSFGVKPNLVLNSIIDHVQKLIEEGNGSEIAPMMIEKFGQNLPGTLQRQILSQFKEMTEQQFRSFYEHSVSVRHLGNLKNHINLANIKIPTLVVMGQLDTIMDLFDSKQATSMIPNGRFLMVKGVGHFLHWEQPDLMPIYEEFLVENDSLINYESCFSA